MKHATLAVLAGGEGSRMGMPKGMLTVEGLPILEFLLRRFASDGPTLLVTSPGREHPPGWEKFDREATDPAPGLGPLRGIVTALESAATEIVICVTVDMPNVSGNQVGWLVERLAGDASMLGLMTRHSIAGGQSVEPFPSAFRRSAMGILKERLKRGLHAVKGLEGEPGFIVADAPECWLGSVWVNLNYPGEYQAFCKETETTDFTDSHG